MLMVNNRKITISCTYFWGFTRIIDLDSVNSCKEINHFIIHECRKWLVENNMLSLVDILDNIVKTKGYHIHGPNDSSESDFFGSILLGNPEETIYVCSH